MHSLQRCSLLAVVLLIAIFNNGIYCEVFNQNVPSGHELDNAFCLDAIGYIILNYNPQVTEDYIEVDNTAGSLFLLVPGIDVPIGEYTVVIQCTNKTANYLESFTFNRKNQNQYSPEFTHNTDPIFIEIAESKVGSTVLTVNATDMDLGMYGVITYTLSGHQVNSLFSLDQQTGDLQLTHATFQYSVYNLTITAENTNIDVDSNVPQQAVAIVKANVDFSPVFLFENINETIYSASVDEGQDPPLDILTVLCQDVETPIGSLKYSLQGDQSVSFSVSSDGLLQANEMLDYESQILYQFSVVCSDGAEKDKATVQIDVLPVNEFTPTIYIGEKYAVVFEIELKAGFVIASSYDDTALYHIDVEDKDAGEDGKLTFTLFGGNEAFIDFVAIDSNNGDVYLSNDIDLDGVGAQLPTLGHLVQACDPDLKCATSKTFSIIPLPSADQLPMFDKSIYTISKDETFISADAILTIRCTDLDYYLGAIESIEFSNASSDIGSYINLATEITVEKEITALIYLQQALDYESNSSYTFDLVCKDTIDEKAYTTVVINILPINDHAPVFTEKTSYYFNVSRTAPSDESYIVGTVLATDADIDLGNNVQYSLNPTASSIYFSINTNGEIILEKSLIDVPENYITLVVKAADDDDKHQVTVGVFIDIETGNYESPEFVGETEVIEISELEPIGYKVLVVFCNDTEEGDNGLISYEIYGGNAGNAFRIDNVTGEIVVDNLLILPQGEDKVTYSLTLKCTDHGVPALFDYGSAIIRVHKADVFNPDIKNETIVIFIDEDVLLNHLVATITAVDLDTENLKYYFLDESDPNAFVIAPTNGEVTVNSVIDRETVWEYFMTVVAEEVLDANNLGEAKNDSAEMFIYVRDINDNSPDCGFLSDTVELLNTLKLDRTIYQLNCIDRDVGNNGNITYTLEDNFDIIGIEVNGRIYLQNPLNNSNSSTFYLKITVSDQGKIEQNQVELTVLVVFLSTNMHIPTFTNLNTSIDVKEDSGTFNSIYTVMAEDMDKGLHGVVRFELLDHPLLPFTLIPNTGQLYLTESLDYYDQNLYILNISATDAEYTVYNTLTINVIDVNEYVPECASTLFTMSVTETSDPSNVEMIELGCVDNDKGLNGDLVYEILTDNDDNEFIIQDGALQLDKKLDYETKEEYDLEIRVSDSGKPPLSTIVTVRIQVLALNEFPPVLAINSFSESITEGIEVGYTVLTVQASDNDNGIHGELKYSLDPSQTDFGITNNGDLIVTGDLDREDINRYNFEVIVTDSGTSPKTATATVDLPILDKDDNSPSFTEDLYTKAVDSENALLNSKVASVECTDLDSGANADVIYTIISSDDSQYFDISDNGDITISQSLSISSIYSFGVMCSGVLNPNLTDTAQVSITIVVESNITFSQTIYNVFLQENTTTGTFLSINASSNNNSPLQYELIDGPTIFQLSMVSGDLMLVGQLDYETKQSYVLEVKATDGGSPPSTATVAVNIIVQNINDKSPLFVTSASTIYITEEKADYSTLGVYKCTDGDLGDYGKILYSLSGYEDGYFLLDETSGELLLGNAFDYEIVQSLTLQITCTDGGNPAKSDTLSIPVTIEPVNEFPPEFSTNNVITISVDESIPVPSILTISNELVATDNDITPHNTAYYTIISGNDDNTFFISSTDGSLTLVKKLDYEEKSLYSLQVAVDDSGGLFNLDYPVLNSTVDVEIIISDTNDNSPMLDKSVYVGSLSESSQIDDHVEMVTLICTDADSSLNGLTTVTIIEGDDDGIFEIDNSNGKVVLKKEVDFESNTFYTLIVRCSDMGSQPKYDDASLTINIEDHSEYGPLFEEEIYEFMINETAMAGSIVGKVTAVDADAGTEGDIVYTADTNGPFAIDSDSGVITVSVPLDYEVPPVSFVFNVTAEDPTEEKDVTIVAINILNVNDNSPMFSDSSYFGTINENSGPGQTVLFAIPVACSDADDEADDIQTTFTLVSDEELPFSIDNEAGSITSNDLLDFEIKNRYSFVIHCFDSGLLKTSANVTVDIESYNEFPPFFINTPYSTIIPEDIGISTNIFTVDASDKDSEDNSITYSISSGNENGEFIVDAISGIVRIDGSIDYETVNSYSLTIAATNVPEDENVSPTLVTDTILDISVTDVNDNDPVLMATSDYVVVTNQTAGYHITTVTCQDEDSGSFGEVTISLTGNNAFQFQLLPNGTIITKSIILKNLILQVNCTDMGSPPHYTIADINVITDDSNDYFPVFQNNSATFAIFENHTVGHDIGCIIATDQDGPNKPSGIIVYSLTLVSGEDHFTVDDNTGCIYVSTALDYDEESSYTYDMIATDKGVPSLFTKIPVFITVKNVVFDPPQFTQTILARSMSENLPAGALVSEGLICTDRDDIDIITYSISNGNDNDNFIVNSTTGVVVLNIGLDYETAESHVITLRCNDSAELYDEAIISVTVIPVNEHTPSIISKVVFADEESPAGTEITIIDYVDNDAGVDGEVMFEIIDVIDESNELFSVVNDVLYFNKSLDRESGMTLYSVLLRITDKGAVPRTSTGFVNVTLSDINDNAPLPGKNIYTTEQVDATVNLTYLIETVGCNDADIGMNAEIMYGIEPNSLLTVDSITGQVTVIGDLRQRETHTIAIVLTCSDKGNPTLSSSFPIQVPVFDPNIFTPAFLEPSYSVTLPENYNLSVTFLNLTATDDDFGLNGKLEYSLSDDFENLFYINSETGEISLLTELDFESDVSYILEVLAIDGAADSPNRKSGSTTVTVNVTGVNEFTPECKKPIYTAIVSEDNTGPILQLNCDDSDKGIDGEITYAISQGQYSNLFAIDSTGWISVPVSISPNASIEVYEIFVTVSDKGNPLKEYQVEVNFIYSFENLNTPVFNDTSYSVSSLESVSVGTVILTVLATDDDPGLQGDIEYTVDGTNYFRVNPTTGEVYISEQLDYEQEMTVTFVVIASDLDPNEPLSSNVTVTISVLDVNDNTPVCDIAFYSTEIGSNLALNETVFNVAGICDDSDGPQNSVLSYSLTPTGTFSIQQDTGVIFVSGQLVAGSSSALTVTVADNGTPSLSTEITVSIVVRFDNVASPQFSKTGYTFNISEDASLLSFIGQVSATDSDSSSNDLEYSLSSTNYKDLFYLDPQTGDIILTNTLDYENIKQYEFNVKVQDSGSHDGTNVLSDEASVTILIENINDNVPILNNNGIYGATVNKTTSIDESIITITCTDDDLPPYANPTIPMSGFTSEIPFELVESGNEWEITVASDLTVIVGSMSYNVNFTCRDQGGMEVIGQVFLSVPDANAPVFNQSVYEWNLKEDSESGEMFTLILATSQDNSDVSYEITDGNSGNIFYIHPNTGIVSLTGSLDFETQSSYALVIEATDGQQRTTTVLLRVFIIDVDDNIPLVPPSASLTIEHNKPPGYPVGSVECVDNDYAGGNFSFNFVESSDKFSINDNGVISITSVLDTTPVYVLPVTCFDVSDPNAISTGIVTIEIIFLNLYDPEFDLNVYEVSINENAQVGSLVKVVSATDDDIGNQGEILYSITSTNDKFYIDAETGNILVLTSLDRETQDEYSLTVVATDGGIVNTTDRRTGTATVNVHILDANDNLPIFLKQSYVATIFINHTILSDVIQVQCTDSDININGQFDYSIQPLHDSFIIDPNGTISLAQSQSDETVYNFYTYCTDKGNPVLSSSALVTVAVSDVELGDPVFTNSSYSVTIPENQALLDSFLTVTATVDNEGIELAYSIIAGNDDNKFTINSNTGELSVIDKLDYNTLSSYTLTVKATTVSFIELSSQVLISILITDVNDNSPIYVPLPFYNGEVDENDVIQTPVVLVNCTDKDTSNVLTYTIFGENPINGDDYFSITEEGLVIIKQNVDYETTTVYTLNVKCSDGENTVDATVRVDVNPINEFQPIFLEKIYKFDIDENATIGKIIGYVNATDNDDGIDGVITFLIDDPGNLSPVFIDPTSGEILLSGILDYEETQFYNVSVIARDSGGSETYVPVEIIVNNLNDEQPVLTPAVTTYDGRIDTDAPSGFFVEYFTCTDEDGGNTVISISSGNNLGYFKLNSFNQLLWNGTTDEIQSDIVVTIMLKCTDEALDEDTASIAIVVGKPGVIPPTFTSNTFIESVKENATINTQVLSVIATPAMSNHTIEYSLFTFDVTFPFAIDSDSGLVTVNNDSLDFETTDFYSFPVQAKDVEDGSISLASIEITVLDINDNNPVLLPSKLSIVVKEDATTDIAYAKFTCSDIDNNENGQTMFLIDDTETFFQISASNGYVYLNKSLDYENTIKHNVTIYCVDGGSPQLTGSATLIVQVTGINEHSPQFNKDSYDFKISENSTLETYVGVVNAIDNDDGINGQFYYEVYGGTGADYFKVGENNGRIFVNNILNASLYDSLTLVIAAIDNGPLAPIISDVIVNIEITDINEKPEFDQISYSALISTDIAMPGDSLGTVSCYDYDLGQNAEISLSILQSNELVNNISLVGDLTANGSVSGELTLNTTLAAGSYEVIINCMDSGNPSLSDMASFGINVKGVNTEPVFNKSIYGLSLHEDIATDEPLLKVTATDAETSITYALLGGIGLGIFQIDEEMGEISLIQNLDYETTTSFELTVGAIDKDDINPKTGSATIAVTVKNINDNNPIISPPTFSATLTEATYNNPLELKQFSCQDADGGSTSFSVTLSPPFDISLEGMVTFIGTADYETATHYTVMVTCTDTPIIGGDLSKQSIATLAVSITPVNFFAPILVSNPVFNVSEGSDIGSVVLQLKASDPDGRGVIEYSTDSYTDVFNLNSKTGEISIMTGLDRETQDVYSLTVLISDGDTEDTPMTSTVNIMINIEDVNDNSPTCTSTLDSIEINANTYNESLSLYNASCYDNDIGNNSILTYAIKDGNVPNEGTFTLDSATGKLSFNGTITKMSTAFVIIIVVSDNGKDILSTPAEIQLILTVATGDEPRFEPDRFSVNISEAVEPLMPIVSGDVFINSLQNAEGPVTFNFNGNSSVFLIDQATGNVLVLSAGLLDYDEGLQLYSLGIQATVGNEIASAILDVYITDHNDNLPKFSSDVYNGSIIENLDDTEFESTVILSVAATDIDSGDNADITYSISTGGDSFEVDQYTGEIRPKKTFDRETISVYSVIVVAKDGGIPALSSSASVSIQINDENDNPPVFAIQQYIITLSDNSKPGTILETITADDPDTTGSLKYSLIINQEDQELLSFIDIEPEDGELRQFSEIPFNHKSIYSFKVQANDIIHSDETNVVLQIATVSSFEFSWIENTPNQTENIFVFLTESYNVSSNAEYEIIEGNSYEHFEITDGGILTHTVLLDRENTSIYFIQILVTDNVTNENFIVNVQIGITDVNDNSPVFESNHYQLNISEGHYNTRTVIGNIRAYDIDAPNTVNSRIEYYLVDTPDSYILNAAVDIINGDVSIIGTIDREHSNKYTLIVQAEDNGEPKPLSDSAFIDIYLSDINDNAPQFSVKNLLGYEIYFTYGNPSNSQPYRIVAQTLFGTNEVNSIEFSDPDSSSTAIATLMDTNNLVDIVSPISPLVIITTTNITYNLNGTSFSIKISDGLPFHDEIVSVTIIVTEVIATSAVLTTTMTVAMTTGTVTVSTTESITPTIEAGGEFITSELGIAIIVVGAILIFAILFFLCCLLCYCYQRYQTVQDRKKQRPTSVFKRVQGDGNEMKNVYNYGDIDNLDHPYLTPDDRHLGQMYGEHNVVETEFTDRMLPPPLMYGNPSYYPHYPPGYGPSYDSQTLSSKLQSDVYENYNYQDEDEEEDSEQSNPAFRKGPGPILDQMLEEFYRGDDILKEDKKKKGSRWSLSKGN